MKDVYMQNFMFVCVSMRSRDEEDGKTMKYHNYYKYYTGFTRFCRFCLNINMFLTLMLVEVKESESEN